MFGFSRIKICSNFCSGGGRQRGGRRRLVRAPAQRVSCGCGGGDSGSARARVAGLQRPACPRPPRRARTAASAAPGALLGLCAAAPQQRESSAPSRAGGSRRTGQAGENGGATRCATDPGTTGLPSIQFYLSDNVVSPPEFDAAYSERLLRIGGSNHYQVCAPPRRHDACGFSNVHSCTFMRSLIRDWVLFTAKVNHYIGVHGRHAPLTPERRERLRAAEALPTEAAGALPFVFCNFNVLYKMEEASWGAPTTFLSGCTTEALLQPSHPWHLRSLYARWGIASCSPLHECATAGRTERALAPRLSCYRPTARRRFLRRRTQPGSRGSGGWRRRTPFDLRAATGARGPPQACYGVCQSSARPRHI
eukprot:SAG11_NODE_2082_length_3849_cov_7.762667_2_plen_364_part_00